MAPGANMSDAQKCHLYAAFADSLTHSQAKGLYWGMFGLVIALLFIASQGYVSADKARRNLLAEEKRVADDFDPSLGLLDDQITKLQMDHAKKAMVCLLLTLPCVVIGVIAIVMETYTALALQFCHQEDTMMFYWGFYNILQIGAIVAIIGIVIGLYYNWARPESPPWNSFLGTPIITIVSFLDMGLVTIKKQIVKKKEEPALPLRSDRNSTNMNDAISLDEGAPIAVYKKLPTNFPPGARRIKDSHIFVQLPTMPETTLPSPPPTADPSLPSSTSTTNDSPLSSSPRTADLSLPSSSSATNDSQDRQQDSTEAALKRTITINT
ncbi:hypothetical protein G7Y89_g641 [Cudoniella acicularis]|uniref:Uncharacterized protein n=1 Tax=Cudoniella acicularis TaxID=354080 RepID=A0A8H4RYG1_9HELO|nr:hypothetical protein G7Y89_g641 [Cudoniella acicularis]